MADLRREVQQVLSGLNGLGGDDPFNERNDWEDTKRSGKADARRGVEKPKSRRAQQAPARPRVTVKPHRLCNPSVAAAWQLADRRAPGGCGDA